MKYYYILDGHKAIPLDDVIEWGKWLSAADRHVAVTTRRNVRVSTVFLGLDHSFGQGPPLLFETMVFGGKHDGDQERYSTWEEAEEGHKKICEIVFCSWKEMESNLWNLKKLEKAVEEEFQINQELWESLRSTLVRKNVELHKMIERLENKKAS